MKKENKARFVETLLKENEKLSNENYDMGELIQEYINEINELKEMIK